MISSLCIVLQVQAWNDFEHFLELCSSEKRMPEKLSAEMGNITLLVQHAKDCKACDEFLQEKVREITRNSQQVH